MSYLQAKPLPAKLAEARSLLDRVRSSAPNGTATRYRVAVLELMPNGPECWNGFYLRALPLVEPHEVPRIVAIVG